MALQVFKTLGKNPDTGSIVEAVLDEERDHVFVRKRIQHINSPLSKTIFQKETEALSRLKSCENIVSLIHADVHENEGIILMEYVHGITLREKQPHITSVAARYNLVRQMINAVRYAHENTVIHRDINPNNILITDEYQLKLIDFGISKIRGSISRAGTTYQFATSGYAAPEVAQLSENATEQSDIYSLGAVILFLFTGAAPPAPDKIQNTIHSAPGLHSLLRNVLCKMCAANPDERYASIDQCDSDLAQLYEEYCDNKERYYFSVPYEQVDALKSRQALPRSYSSYTILKENFPKEFSYGHARGRTAGGNMVYIFDGRTLTMECGFSDGVFQIARISRLDAFKREQNRRYSFPVYGKMEFLYPKDIHPETLRDSSNDTLHNRFIDHANDLRSRESIDRAFEDRYGLWSQYLQAMIQNASENALRLDYKLLSIKDGTLTLRLDEETRLSALEEGFTQETAFAFEKEVKENKKQLRPVGTYLSLQNDGQLTTIAIKKAPRCVDLPPSGTICVDYSKEITQYNRQERALTDFIRIETNNNGNLKSIFTGIEAPERLVLSAELEYFDERLDLTQKAAVRKVMEANDIVMIQGPPGTGKTNVLVEVVRQILKQNALNPALKNKILIVSQSHAAVDNILENLEKHLAGVTTIRIGSEDSITPHINSLYGLYHCEQGWTRESVQKCENKLSSQLAEKHIAPDDFLAFAEAVEALKVKNAPASEKTACEAITSSFLAAYNLEMDSPYLQQCLAMSQWCRHLEEEKGLGEYYIKSAAIVAGTCSGFISNQFVRDIVFDCVIVDEAAKATLPELFVPMIRAKKVVLVGDHLQLPPVLHTDIIRRIPQLNVRELENAGFARLWEILPDESRQKLDIQYRMHPRIGSLISELFYESSVGNGIEAEERAIKLPFLNGRPITWLTTTYWPGEHMELQQQGSNGKKSYQNSLEVTVLQKCLSRLDKEMQEIGESYTVGIITPYRAQLELIRQRLRHETYRCFTPDANTVDAFQGSQRDIIIYSTVRKNDHHEIGFMDREARLNVSLSRAKRALIIIGDSKFFNDPKIRRNIFRPILQYIMNHREDCKVIDAKEAVE